MRIKTFDYFKVVWKDGKQGKWAQITYYNDFILMCNILNIKKDIPFIIFLKFKNPCVLCNQKGVIRGFRDTEIGQMSLLVTCPECNGTKFVK